jgi:hypothetical protein
VKLRGVTGFLQVADKELCDTTHTANIVFQRQYFELRRLNPALVMY